MSIPFTNWSGRHTSMPADRAAPKSEDEVCEIVRRAVATNRRVKVVGAGHSFSDIAMTDGVLVSLDAMDKVLAIDLQRGIVRVQAGKRLAAFCAEMAGAGLTLPILGSIAAQSLGGLVATGTHGSSLRHGNLATQIVAMRLVNGDGDVVVLDEGDPRLAGARVSLGLLGIVTELSLQLEPMFTVAESTHPMPFEAGVDRFSAEMSAHEYTKFWWLPHTNRAQVFTGERTADKANFSERQRTFDENVVNAWVFPVVLWLGNLFPGLIGPFNRLIGALYFKRTRTVGSPHRVLTLAMPPRHFEAEWAIPVEHFTVAIRRVRDLVETLHVNFILEARLVRADQNWMSPAYGRDSVQIGTYITNPADRDAFFAGAAAIFTDYGGRPHWGKENSLDGAAASPLYPEFPAFAALVKELDPAATFSNAMRERLLR